MLCKHVMLCTHVMLCYVLIAKIKCMYVSNVCQYIPCASFWLFSQQTALFPLDLF